MKVAHRMVRNLASSKEKFDLCLGSFVLNFWNFSNDRNIFVIQSGFLKANLIFYANKIT